MIADLAMQRALDRYHATGITGLTEEERTLATLWCFESKVANGGFENLYRAQEGELAAYAPTAFRNIGAKELATVAEQANQVFGAGGIPAGRKDRRQVIEHLSPEARCLWQKLEMDYEEFGVDLDERIEAYALRMDSAKRQRTN